MGDSVYYRMGNNPQWSGPGKVIAQDNKLVFIRHGRNLVVASPSRIQPAHQNHTSVVEQYTHEIDQNKPVGHGNIQQEGGQELMISSDSDTDSEVSSKEQSGISRIEATEAVNDVPTESEQGWQTQKPTRKKPPKKTQGFSNKKKKRR